MTPEALELLRDAALERQRLERELAALPLQAELKAAKAVESELRSEFEKWYDAEMIARNKRLASGEETPIPKLPFSTRIDRQVVITGDVPIEFMKPDSAALKKALAKGPVQGARLSARYVAVIK